MKPENLSSTSNDFLINLKKRLDKKNKPNLFKKICYEIKDFSLNKDDLYNKNTILVKNKYGKYVSLSLHNKRKNVIFNIYYVLNFKIYSFLNKFIFIKNYILKMKNIYFYHRDLFKIMKLLNKEYFNNKNELKYYSSIILKANKLNNKLLLENR